MKNYDLKQSGAEVQELLDQVPVNKKEIERLKQLYAGLSKTDVEIVASLPSVGVANTIYRVTGSDGYADYMFDADDLSTAILLATYGNGIDEEPVAGSENLVKSGGVKKTVDEIGKRMIDDNADDFKFTDLIGNIIASIGIRGVNAKGYNVCNANGDVIGTIDADFFEKVLSVSSIIDNLESTSATAPLAAAQGKVLSDRIKNYMKKIEDYMVDDGSAGTFFADKYGNVAMRLHGDGASVGKINLCNQQGETMGFILRGDDGSICFCDQSGLIAFKIDNNGTVDFNGIGSNLSRKIQEIADTRKEVKEVIVVGSSSVAGAGSEKLHLIDNAISKMQALGFDTSTMKKSGNMPFGEILNVMLGADYKVLNFGVGGENIFTIGARSGAMPALVPKKFVLPKDKTKVLIADESESMNLLSSWNTKKSCFPLLQGGYSQVNPCTIEGIECVLSCTYDSGYTNRKYYLQRTTEGDRDVTIPSLTPINPKMASSGRNKRIAVICNWYNAGYDTDEELVDIVKATVSNLNCDDFVLIDKYSATESNASAREETMTKYFGDRYINFRKYLSTNALYDWGITPTTDADLSQEQLLNGVKSDTYQMSIGGFPSSLWSNCYGIDGATSNDMSHMTRCGYTIMAYKIYERIKVLGLI
jgi:hypothetical protein